MPIYVTGMFLLRVRNETSLKTQIERRTGNIKINLKRRRWPNENKDSGEFQTQKNSA
jgi:hypothetical protein